MQNKSRVNYTLDAKKEGLLISTPELLKFLGWVYQLEKPFPYSRLDFWFKRDLFGIASKPGAGNTRYFDYDDIVCIKIVIDIQRTVKNLELAKHAGEHIRSNIENQGIYTTGWILIQGEGDRSVSIVNSDAVDISYIKTIVNVGADLASKYHGDPLTIVSIPKIISQVNKYFEVV